MYTLTKQDTRQVSGSGLAQDISLVVQLSVDAYEFGKGVVEGIEKGWEAEGKKS